LVNEVNSIESSRPYHTNRVFTPLVLNPIDALKRLERQGFLKHPHIIYLREKGMRNMTSIHIVVITMRKDMPPIDDWN